MPKVSPIQSSFSTGEISPLLYGQVEFDNYKSALKVLELHLEYKQEQQLFLAHF
jgi:hypothetical protein